MLPGSQVSRLLLLGPDSRRLPAKEQRRRLELKLGTAARRPRGSGLEGERIERAILNYQSLGCAYGVS